MNIRSHKGFTLIEVLVASAIVVAAMGLLLNLFASGLDRLHRVSLHSELIVSQKEINNRLSTLNPALEQSGQGDVSGLLFSWRTSQLSAFHAVSDVLGEENTLRKVALFKIDVTLETERSAKREWSLVRIGWREAG